MKQLLSYEDFKELKGFNLGNGLCNNIDSLIEPDYCNDLGYFLKSIGLNLSYPIKRGGYNKRLKHRSSTDYLRTSWLYDKNSQEKTLYTGMQDALRHNLYNRYCAWLVKNWPEKYAYAAQD